MAIQKNLTKKQKLRFAIGCIIAMFSSLYLASASYIPLQDLISSYDFSFSNRTLNVTSQTDYMIDTNGNGINDLLVIDLATDALTPGTYKFIVEIDNGNGAIVNDTTKFISSTDRSASINFPTSMLAKQKFNYSIRVNVDDYNSIFRKSNVPSNTYSSYESGASITRITDENANNNFIRINLTVNSTQTMIVNVTVTLAFNSSTISATEEKILSNGLQVVSVKFDNETIKNTHYNGDFTLNRILVGNKVFNLNRKTSIYNYENFAKSPYINSIKSKNIDTNSNSLAEFLEINFTVVSFEASVYNLSYDLYDQFGNYVASNTKQQPLPIGSSVIQSLINGPEIYKTKINGPYVVSFAKLAASSTKDVLLNAHTTNNTLFTDYERPPLPDLKIELVASLNQTTSINAVKVNLSNIGYAPAFNVFLDVFDNSSFSGNGSVPFLNIGESITYDFSVANSSVSALITAIADFDNLVDEPDEANNIAQFIFSSPIVVQPIAQSISEAYSDGTLRIFELEIFNNSTFPLTGIQWQFDTGNNNIINSVSNISSLPKNERAYIYLPYNYTGLGAYSIKSSVAGISQSAVVKSSVSSTISIAEISGITITSFDDFPGGITSVVFESQVSNLLNQNLTGVNWTINTGNGNFINSAIPIVLPANSNTFIYAAFNYTSNGNYTSINTVSNPFYSDSKSNIVIVNST